MTRRIKIDRSIYIADDDARTYVFLERNPDWRSLDPAVRERNKKSIDEYTRIFRDGTTKVYRFQEAKQ